MRDQAPWEETATLTIKGNKVMRVEGGIQAKGMEQALKKTSENLAKKRASSTLGMVGSIGLWIFRYRRLMKRVLVGLGCMTG